MWHIKPQLQTLVGHLETISADQNARMIYVHRDHAALIIDITHVSLILITTG